jgi:hypothetical protein
MRFGDVIVIVTPGRALPSSSDTLPSMIPVTLDWARTYPERRMRMKKDTHEKRQNFNIDFLLRRFLQQNI